MIAEKDPKAHPDCETSVLSKLDLSLQLAVDRWRKQNGRRLRGASPEKLEVILKFSGELASLADAGFQLGNSFADHAVGSIDVSCLESLAALNHVHGAWRAPQLRPALDKSVVAIGVPSVWNGAPSFKGRGVIVGIIDSGIDIAHKNFRNPANQHSRILRLWDQTRTDLSETRAPRRFKLPGFNNDQLIPSTRYGAEYTQEELTGILQHAPDTKKDFPGIENPILHDPRTPPGLEEIPHGTHVAGIAAGNGKQSTYCHGADTYVGVAPEADLVVVKYVGKIENLMDAFYYIINFAGTPSNFPDILPRPVVICCSLGATETSSLNPQSKKVLDDPLNALLAASPSRVVVAAAMNEAHKRQHALVDIPANTVGPVTVPFRVPSNDFFADEIDLSFVGSNQMTVTLRSPKAGGIPLTLAAPTAAKQQGNVDGHDVHYTLGVSPATLANSTSLCLSISPRPSPTPQQVGTVLEGVWKLELLKPAGKAVRVEAWIRLGGDKAPVRFEDSSQVDPSNTIVSPALAKNVIAVGNYSALEAGDNFGRLALSSGQGLLGAAPADIKPDVVAPGEGVWSAKSNARRTDSKCSECCVDYYIQTYGGTSMSAPHVAGVVALMFEKNKTLSFNQVRSILRDTTTKPDPALNMGPGVPPVGQLPNHRWGWGIVNASKAVNAVSPSSSAAQASPVSITQMSDARVAPNLDNPDPKPPPLVPDLLVITPELINGFSVPWPMEIPGLAHRLRGLDRLLVRSPGLQTLVALISTHADEVQSLVNANRRVAAVWRRRGGPALVRHLLSTSPSGDLVIPAEVAGFSIKTLMVRLLAILQRFGGERLRSDAARYRDLVLHSPGARLSDLDRFVTPSTG